MRRNYIVTYDIRDPKRLNRVFRKCKGFGIHLQYSVFECDLSDAERIQFEAELCGILNLHEDQVLFIDLGPVSSRHETSITALGQAYHRFMEPCYVS
jgi:CRISPR-associated protein Cas2